MMKNINFLVLRLLVFVVVFLRFSNGEDETFVPDCRFTRANVRQAHPFDSSKFYLCRNTLKFEIFTCPNAGRFDDRWKSCLDLCEQKKPCLNEGQCIIHKNLTLECVCRQDWTGDRCEIPRSQCVHKPCGAENQCQMLIASDYSQDYVCICDDQQRYGRNCQQTVPNPCRTSKTQFHPFAFSRRSYINCDGERIFFQPCFGQMYWNQEEKRCDPKIPNLVFYAQVIAMNPTSEIREQFSMKKTNF